MRKAISGFTIVEVIVVTVIIGVLAGITILSYDHIETNKRDFQRQSNTTVMATALEKYYTDNNEYPSCDAISGSAATVISSVLPELDLDNLVTPNRPDGETNSIRCGDMASVGPVEDVYAYDGDNSADCVGNIACLEWTLQYREERTGSVKTIESLHKAATTTLASTNLTATAVSSSNIDLTWTAVAGATSFALQRATNSAFTAGLVANTVDGTSLSVGELDAGTLYYFRIAPLATGTQGAWASANAQTIQNAAPAGPSVSVALSGSNINSTINSVACANGATTQYGLRFRSNNGSWTGYSAWSTTTTQTNNAFQGSKYDYQAQARCLYPDATASIGAVGAATSYVYAINTPAAPTMTASTSGNVTKFSWNATSCPVGTTARYQYKFIADWGYNTAWYGPYTALTSRDWTTSSQGYQYTTQAQTHCYTSFDTSDWSGTGGASYIRPISAPGAVSYGGYRGDYRTIYMYATSSCGSGANLMSRADLHTWDFNWTPTPPTAYGWYRDRFGTWVINAWSNYGNTITTGSQTNNPNGIPSGSRWNIAVEMRCQNFTTGRIGPSSGYKESGAYAL